MAVGKNTRVLIAKRGLAREGVDLTAKKELRITNYELRFLSFPEFRERASNRFSEYLKTICARRALIPLWGGVAVGRGGCARYPRRWPQVKNARVLIAKRGFARERVDLTVKKDAGIPTAYWRLTPVRCLHVTYQSSGFSDDIPFKRIRFQS